MNGIEPVLYMDLQALPPGIYCRICGSECYRPGLRCLRCERDLS